MAITHDKLLAKRLLIQDNILTPKYIIYNGQCVTKEIRSSLRFPIIIKPSHEETSMVHTIDDLQTIAMNKWKKYQQPILCEEYIVGKEYTIAVFGDENSSLNDLEIIGPAEISWKNGDCYTIYTYEFKQSFNHVDSICAVKFDTEEQMSNVCLFAKRVFMSLGCRDICRIDFHIDHQGSIYFLELNGLSGLTPNYSDLVLMANKCGMSYKAIIKRVLTPAVNRYAEKKLAKTE
ncbi:hypothetical protein I4U23_022540 [Adineta vaga]|nr:hypothetical protein I4U23_022540 [Adineta vaga]